VACTCDDGVQEARSISGATAELSVQSDLLRRGYRVYALVAESQHPDLSVLDRNDEHFTVEIRAEQKGGHRRKKPGDRCDVYAWVSRDGQIEYEPPLWQRPEEIQ
jgi:hypothetical protein